MLNIKDLKSGYNGMEILHGINFEIEPASITSIIGPNGSGKSTFLKSIFNLTNINSGKIIFKDKDITNLQTHELIREGIGFVPQGRQVFSDMTVQENLEMGAYIFSDKEIIKKNIQEIYDRFPILKQKKNDNASTLSGGQQQLLSIARALIQNPELLLLDEPSLGLSPIASKEIFEKIVEINNEGVTVIIVEQNIKQAIEISKKIYLFKNGQIALSGSRDTFSGSKLEEIYLK